MEGKLKVLDTDNDWEFEQVGMLRKDVSILWGHENLIKKLIPKLEGE